MRHHWGPLLTSRLPTACNRNINIEGSRGQGGPGEGEVIIMICGAVVLLSVITLDSWLSRIEISLHESVVAESLLSTNYRNQSLLWVRRKDVDLGSPPVLADITR